MFCCQSAALSVRTIDDIVTVTIHAQATHLANMTMLALVFILTGTSTDYLLTRSESLLNVAYRVCCVIMNAGLLRRTCRGRIQKI